jgi:hypothetical protein
MPKKNPYPVEIFEQEKGKKQVLISRKDFESLMDRLENGYDLKIAAERLKNPGKPIPWKQVKKELFGEE